MDIDQDAQEEIITRFGEINFIGLKQLEDNYNTYQIDDGTGRVRKVIGTLRELLVNMERLKAGAQELIDGDSSFSFIRTFSVEECGDIGGFAIEIFEELDDCSNEIDKACKQLAPLQRLLPMEDNTVYIDYQDALDAEEEEDWI